MRHSRVGFWAVDSVQNRQYDALRKNPSVVIYQVKKLVLFQVSVAKELAAGKLVKNLTLFPSIQITLVHPGQSN